MKYSVRNPPAYPHQIGVNYQQDMTTFQGLSLLDAFALNAPKEIPSWFKPGMPEKPKLKSRVVNFFTSEIDKIYIGHYWNDVDNEWVEPQPGDKTFHPIEQREVPTIIPKKLKEDVINYSKKWEESFNMVQAWEENEKIQRLIQWPYHYANLMLDHRLKIITNEQTENNPGE